MFIERALHQTCFFPTFPFHTTLCTATMTTLPHLYRLNVSELSHKDTTLMCKGM